MNAVALGLVTALCWGCADLLARHTGQALGAKLALLGVMLAGSAGLSAWMVWDGTVRLAVPSWWTVGAALLATAAMLLFYEAMRRGPVSLVSPATAAYPAWAVLFSMALGLHPSPFSLAAMAMTLGGVLLVACFAASPPGQSRLSGHGPTLALSVIASLMFGALLLIAQQAILRDGELLVVWWGRITAAALMILLVAADGRLPRPPPLPLALTALQGILDTLGLVSLFAAGQDMDAALASVVSSAFGAVTVVLARLIYREPLTPGQIAGILCVFCGVAGLAAMSA